MTGRPLGAWRFRCFVAPARAMGITGLVTYQLRSIGLSVWCPLIYVSNRFHLSINESYQPIGRRYRRPYAAGARHVLGSLSAASLGYSDISLRMMPLVQPKPS